MYICTIFPSTARLSHPVFFEGRELIQRSNCQQTLDHRINKGISCYFYYFCFTDYTKAFVWIITNCRKLLKKLEYQTTLPVS